MRDLLRFFRVSSFLTVLLRAALKTPVPLCGMRFPRNQTSRVEPLNRRRSSADISVCGFWRLSSRRSARRQSPVRLHRHGTRMSREPADRNVRATRFMGRARGLQGTAEIDARRWLRLCGAVVLVAPTAMLAAGSSDGPVKFTTHRVGNYRSEACAVGDF